MDCKTADSRGKSVLEEELLSHYPGYTLKYCTVVQSKRMPSGNLQTKCDCDKPFSTVHYDDEKKVIHIHPDGKSIHDALDDAIFSAEDAKSREGF